VPQLWGRAVLGKGTGTSVLGGHSSRERTGAPALGDCPRKVSQYPRYWQRPKADQKRVGSLQVGCAAGLLALRVCRRGEVILRKLGHNQWPWNWAGGLPSVSLWPHPSR
jgi:hypothetical protein